MSEDRTLLVVERNGKATVVTGWRAVLLAAAALLGGVAALVIAAILFVGIAATIGAILLVTIPAALIVAGVSAILGRRRQP